MLFKKRINRKCASVWVHSTQSLYLLQTRTRSSRQTWQILKMKGLQCKKILLCRVHTVSHRSEYTPHIFVNILLYIFLWQHWRNYTFLQCKIVYSLYNRVHLLSPQNNSSHSHYQFDAVCGVWSEHWQADPPPLQPLEQCWQHSNIYFIHLSPKWRGLFWVEPVLLNHCIVLATVLQLSFRVLVIFL